MGSGGGTITALAEADDEVYAWWLKKGQLQFLGNSSSEQKIWRRGGFVEEQGVKGAGFDPYFGLWWDDFYYSYVEINRLL